MYDLSKEKDVGFLKEANRWLQEELVLANKKIIELLKQKQIDDEICNKLSDELHILRQKFFANKQESKKNGSSKKNRKKGKLPHNQSPLGDGVSTKENVSLEEDKQIYLIEKIKCTCGDPDCKLREIKGCYEESSEIEVLERRYILIRHQRQKYTGTVCGKVITAPGKKKLISGGEFSAQMGVQVACDKFERHLPLERQRKEMENFGLKVGTKTLFGLTEQVYNHLLPVVELIREEILSRPWTHIDESPFTFFNPKKSKGYVWSLSNNYGAYYQFEPTRSGKVAKELLEKFKGVVVTDGYAGYDWIDKSNALIHAFCWAHVRRKFFDSMKNYPKAEEMVDLIDALYSIEHKAKNFDELKVLRKTESREKVNEIEKWIDDLQGKYLESSSIGKAINYLNESW